jgi:hypothetical protein
MVPVIVDLPINAGQPVRPDDSGRPAVSHCPLRSAGEGLVKQQPKRSARNETSGTPRVAPTA